MCSPAAVAGTAQGAGGIAGFVQARREARAANNRNEVAFKRTRRLAFDDAQLNYGANRDRQREAREDAATEIQTLIERATQAVGTARVSGAASGVAGGTVRDLLGDLGQQQLDFIAAAERTVTRTDRQARREDAAIEAQFSARVLNALPTPIPKPSFLAALLNTGSKVAGAAARGTA